MAKAKKKAANKKKAPKESLVVGSKVKSAINAAGCNTGGDALEGLNNWLYWLVEQATQRAQSNGRKTVRSHDFMVG